MKSCVILALAVAVGFDLVAANTVKQTVDKDLLLPESNDSSTNPAETLSNQKEQKKIETNLNSEAAVEDQTQEITLEIDIEENIQSPLDNFDFQEAIDNQLGLEEFNNDQFNLEENIDTNFENDFEIVNADDYVYNDVIYKDPNEIMDTAAGFVPIPIIRKRKKQTPRRQATRRNNRRPYASRRHYYFYPYYRYYRPSSLRYYSYY